VRLNRWGLQGDSMSARLLGARDRSEPFRCNGRDTCSKCPRKPPARPSAAPGRVFRNPTYGRPFMQFARIPHAVNFRHGPPGLKLALVAAFALAAASTLAACGPTIFEDASVLSVVGDPPPPPPKPKVVQEKPKRVVVEENRIKINEKIEFDFNKATIRAESDDLLSEIISVIKENPHIKKIAIEGHTSSEGSDKYNLK